MGAQLLLLPDKKQIEKKKALMGKEPGKPLSAITIKNCELTRQVSDKATTDKAGLAILHHTTTAPATLVAKKGKDRAFIQDVCLLRFDEQESLLWHLFDDRRCVLLPFPSPHALSHHFFLSSLLFSWSACIAPRRKLISKATSAS